MSRSLTAQQIKNIHRAQKHSHRQRKKLPPLPPPMDVIDCACVIHSNGYDWVYVERLYNMLQRNISLPIRFHVYTEATRSVPSHMIHHVLEDWGVNGPRRSWWYKMQLFNPEHHAGHLLYFDLDTVITNNIDWLWQSDPRFFWAVQDFKRLWQPTNIGINSSIMWWDTRRWHWIWHEFKRQHLGDIFRKYHGDQDYLTTMIDPDLLRYWDNNRIQSYRWQALDGGYDFTTRRHITPGTGVHIDPCTSVLIFHGNPKPHNADNAVIAQHWR